MKALFLTLLTLPCFVFSSQIQWYCSPDQLNATSDGQTMDQSFRFELGVFKDGFEPTTENLDQWAENWVPAQRAVYDTANGWFTSVFQVTDNRGDFRKGAKAYIWGFGGDPAEGEWILCRSNNWNWPKANPRKPVPSQWNMASATVVVLGDVSNGQISLKSTLVTNVLPPKTQWNQWAVANLGNASADPSADGNNNGIEDGLEFVLGIDGRTDVSASGIRIRITKNGNGKAVELVVPRRKDRPANIEVQMSADLKKWSNASDLIELQEDRMLEVIFRDTAGTTELEGPWFWRYKVTPIQ